MTEEPIQQNNSCDLGEGLTAFRAGERVFFIDVVGWMRWYIEASEQLKGKGFALLDAANASERFRTW